MNEMMQYAHMVRQEWLQAIGPFIVLCCAMVLDVFMGLLIAISGKRVSSSASWRGITRKAGVLILIAFASVMDPLVPLPVALGVTIGYIIPEGISLIENGAKLRIVKNKNLIDALERLRQGNEESAAAAVKVVQPIQVVVPNDPEKKE